MRTYTVTEVMVTTTIATVILVGGLYLGFQAGHDLGYKRGVSDEKHAAFMKQMDD